MFIVCFQARTAPTEIIPCRICGCCEPFLNLMQVCVLALAGSQKGRSLRVERLLDTGIVLTTVTATVGQDWKELSKAESGLIMAGLGDPGANIRLCPGCHSVD